MSCAAETCGNPAAEKLKLDLVAWHCPIVEHDDNEMMRP